MLVVSGKVVEFSSLEVNEQIAHWLKGAKPPRRIISFFELLGRYIGVRLWAPNSLCNKVLLWIAIPIVTDNLGNDFILRKHYTTTRPTSWMLQELAAHSLTTNTTIVAKHMKGIRENGLYGQA